MTDSLKKRYTYKLITSFVNIGLGFITLGLVPRALGPESYGNYGFLTTFFGRTMKFLAFATPRAYLTKLSKRLNEKKLVGFYVYYVFFLCVLISTGTIVIISLGFQNIIWPNQKTGFILAAVLFAILSFISIIVQQTNDAFGLTKKMEIVFIIKSFLTTGFVLLLIFIFGLTLESFFIIHYLLFAFIIIAGCRILMSQRIFITKQLRLSKKEVVSYIKEFYNYSHPLFFVMLTGFIMVISDRWLLQNFSGSAEQGYYTLALKINSLILVFTSSMATLLLREMSIRYKDGNKEEIASLFKKYIPLFYFITAYLALFISFNAGTISAIIGGTEYKDANMVITIMAFYPIYQAYSQLSGSVFFATEQTKIIRNLWVSSNLIGIPVSFLLIATPNFYGLDLGALGLAIKLVLFHFIVVNFQLWKISKFIKISFKRYFCHQLIVLTSLAFIVFGSKYLSSVVTKNLVANFLMTGTIYTFLVGFIIFLFPILIAVTRAELKNKILSVFEHS